MVHILAILQSINYFYDLLYYNHIALLFLAYVRLITSIGYRHSTLSLPTLNSNLSTHANSIFVVRNDPGASNGTDAEKNVRRMCSTHSEPSAHILRKIGNFEESSPLLLLLPFQLPPSILFSATSSVSNVHE